MRFTHTNVRYFHFIFIYFYIQVNLTVRYQKYREKKRKDEICVHVFTYDHKYIEKKPTCAPLVGLSRSEGVLPSNDLYLKKKTHPHSTSFHALPYAERSHRYKEKYEIYIPTLSLLNINDDFLCVRDMYDTNSTYFIICKVCCMLPIH